jgi:pyruvate dehydrogenase E1 component
MPNANRSDVYRTLVCFGINRVPQEKKQQASTFKEYEPGYLHIDVTYLPKLAGKKQYLFVAIDRATRMLYFEIYALNRGGHDPFKVFQAYRAAKECSDKPTVILAKTVKGYGMGEAGEGQNTTHSQKKLGLKQVAKFAKRFDIPVTEEDVKQLNFYKPAQDSEEMTYINTQRQKLGGSLPVRSFELENLQAPELNTFSALLKSSGEREMSTTMALNRIMALLVRDKQLGSKVVPIIPDEARTFGMESLFRQLGIYSASGQLYQPEDSDKVMWYKEDKKGQVLQEGINEAGAISDWIAAATSYATHNVTMIPFYIYYSKFGFQRVGDLIWAAGDMQAKGFLIGGTAGRTTLNGEGLQHEDGDSHIVANIIPNCISYDPTYAYELAVIVQSGLRRMYEKHENIFYYITVMNEIYTHPKILAGTQEGIIKGIYPLKKVGTGDKQVQLLGSGTILREVEKAAQMLTDDWGVKSNIWSGSRPRRALIYVWILDKNRLGALIIDFLNSLFLFLYDFIIVGNMLLNVFLQ